MKQLSVFFLGVAAVAVFIAAGCASPGRTTPGLSGSLARTSFDAAAAHGTIPLVKNTADKDGFHILLTFGSSTASPQPVLFDTGSTGLWIYSDRISSKDYTNLNIPVQYSYVSGIQYRGTLVRSTVTFAGSGLTTGQVRFAVVTSATCKADSNCSRACAKFTSVITCLETTRGLSGTFGASLQPNILVPTNASSKKYVIFNLIFGIAQPWASVFVVTPKNLIVGPMATPGFTLVRLSPGPKVNATPNSGAVSWHKPAPICYTITGKGINIRNYCTDSVFDTGEGGVTFYGLPQTIATVPTKCGSLIPSGATVRMFMANATIALLKTGNKQNWNEFSVKPPVTITGGKTNTYANTGVTFFNRNEILFDGAAGLTGFRPFATPAKNFVNVCAPAAGSV